MEVWRNNEQDGLIDGFLRRISEHALRGSVPGLDDARRVLGDDCVVRRIDNGSQIRGGLCRVASGTWHEELQGENFFIVLPMSA
jgi:hypothetical protein